MLFLESIDFKKVLQYVGCVLLSSALYILGKYTLKVGQYVGCVQIAFTPSGTGDDCSLNLRRAAKKSPLHYIVLRCES